MVCWPIRRKSPMRATAVENLRWWQLLPLSLGTQGIFYFHCGGKVYSWDGMEDENENEKSLQQKLKRRKQ